MERNLLIVGWVLIVPSVGLLFEFNGFLFSLLVIGSLLRLVYHAIRLPSGERDYFRYLPLLAGLVAYLSDGWFEWFGLRALLLVLWGFLIYSEWRVFQFLRREESSPRDPK
ncbi:MAG: hypothetical protein AAGF67_13615 [Verrucomicrobiota bacterium]